MYRQGDGLSGRSTFLFATPNWLDGAARTLDMGSTLTNYNFAPTPEAGNAISSYLDWAAVGDDLRQVILRRVEELDADSSKRVADALRTHLAGEVENRRIRQLDR